MVTCPLESFDLCWLVVLGLLSCARRKLPESSRANHNFLIEIPLLSNGMATPLHRLHLICGAERGLLPWVSGTDEEISVTTPEDAQRGYEMLQRIRTDRNVQTRTVTCRRCATTGPASEPQNNRTRQRFWICAERSGERSAGAEPSVLQDPSWFSLGPQFPHPQG